MKENNNNKGYTLTRSLPHKKSNLEKMNIGMLNFNAIENPPLPSEKNINIFQILRKNFVLILTFIFILYFYYIYIFLYILPILYSSSNGLDYRFWFFLNDAIYRKGFIYCFIFNLLLFLTILTMKRLIFSDAGTINQEYIKYFNLLPDKTNLQTQDDTNNSILPISNDSFDELFIEDVKQNTTPEFFYKFLYYVRDLIRLPEIYMFRTNKLHCVFCRIVRPERTHHCRKCRKCILKMDHHCNILNTCIGLYNYKLYIIFLFYSTITLLFLIVTMIDGIKFYLSNFGWEDNKTKVFIFTFALIAFFFISIIELFFSHIIYLSKGVTTIEYEGESSEVLFENNKSCFENIKSVFKSGNPITWLWPSYDKFEPYEGYIDKRDIDEYIRTERVNFLKEINKRENIEYIGGIDNSSIMNPL